MKYKIIFTTGYDDDLESISKELKCDVLILDEKNDYYNPQFITIERIKGEFEDSKICYLEDNLVILHKVTKDNILNSIAELDKWKFTKRWKPLDEKQLVEYFYPKNDWLIFDIEI
ncbi:MAG: hypothetical protein ACOVOW_13335 [Spirosomataceae bacterium]